jgi:hypothetical protein
VSRIFEDSSAVVLARYPAGVPVPQLAFSETRHVAWTAFGIAILCGSLVFSFLALRERSLSREPSVVEKIGPVVPRKLAVVAGPAVTDQTKVEARPESLALRLLARQDRKVTQFILAESPDFQRLGAVQLKLTGVDAARGSYSLLLMANGRQFDKTNIKLNEPVNISPTGARTAPEIVVDAIVPGGVQGYLSEPNHRRWHRRHRSNRSKA